MKVLPSLAMYLKRKVEGVQGSRFERVAELLREELGLLLVRQVKDPAVQGVTITAVRVTPDISTAIVFFAATDRNEKKIGAGLERAAPFLRRELGKKLRMKRTPQLRFKRDEVLEEGAHIDSILQELEDPEAEGESS